MVIAVMSPRYSRALAGFATTAAMGENSSLVLMQTALGGTATNEGAPDLPPARWLAAWPILVYASTQYENTDRGKASLRQAASQAS